MQTSLFAEPIADVVLSPLCGYMKHCGATAALGEPEDHGECVNRSITCQRCGATGVQSTNMSHR